MNPNVKESMLTLHVRQLNFTYQHRDGFHKNSPGLAEWLASFEGPGQQGKTPRLVRRLESAATTTTRKSDSTAS